VYVARQLGHSNPRITLTTHAHYFAAADHAQAARTAIDSHHHAQTMETAVVTDGPHDWLDNEWGASPRNPEPNHTHASQN
jgi:hypothetical protein